MTYVGELSIAAAVPAAAVAVSAGAGGINAALPDIAAQLAAFASFAPTPVDFAAQLALTQQTLSGVQASIATPGLTPPDISTQIALITAQIAALTASMASISAQLSLITGIQSQLAAAGIYAYAYSGPVSGMGTELAAETSGGLPAGGPATACNALVFATITPATWATMSTFFKVTP